MMSAQCNNIFNVGRASLPSGGRGTYHGVFDCVHQPDDVGPTAQVLQDLDLPLDLLLLDRLIPRRQKGGGETSGDNDRRGI